jgi:hypothetical protein
MICYAQTLKRKGKEMTQNEFLTACMERTIDPAIALENDAVRAALKAHDRQAVLTALDNEF